MRAAFTASLVELAGRDPRIVLLTGDLGYTVLEPFAERFPDRFINVGAAEQNMAGLATGMAEAGFIPYIYSIVPFATLRPYEFIRNGAIAHRLPVRVVGVGGGFEYGTNGISHYGLEDIGVMRMQPGMMVVAPADPEQARTALLATWDNPGPIYYRLGKDDKAIVPGLNGRYRPDAAEIIGHGGDLLLLAMGAITTDAVAAQEILALDGIKTTLSVVSTLNPAPVADLCNTLSRFKDAITIEAHYVTGGLGSLVSEIVAEHGLSCRITRCGVTTTPDGVTGSQAYLHERYGISPNALALTARRVLNGRPKAAEPVLP